MLMLGVGRVAPKCWYMSNHLTGGPPATPPHVQYEYPLNSEPLLMALMDGAPLGVAMVGVPGRINHKDGQRTMCDVCDPPGHTRANRPNVRNLTRHSRSYRRHLREGAIRVGCGYATRHIRHIQYTCGWASLRDTHGRTGGRHEATEWWRRGWRRGWWRGWWRGWRRGWRNKVRREHQTR